MSAFWTAFGTLTANERMVLALPPRHRRTIEDAAAALRITAERACHFEARGRARLEARVGARERFQRFRTPEGFAEAMAQDVVVAKVPARGPAASCASSS